MTMIIISMLLVSMIPTSAYTIINDKVYVDDAIIYLSAEPHTIGATDIDPITGVAMIYFNLTPKTYTGNIDVCWGFNDAYIIPIKIEYYQPQTRTWVVFPSDIKSLNYDYLGSNKWFYAQNLPVIAGKNYTVRASIKIPARFGRMNCKYNFAVKPSSLSIQQAISQGYLYVLDPWVDVSWGKRRALNISNPNAVNLRYFELPLNITYDSDMNSNFSDIRIVNDTANDTVPYWIEKKVDGSYCNIWINFTNITATTWMNNTYYMYYNSSGAESASNPETTFKFYDVLRLEVLLPSFVGA